MPHYDLSTYLADDALTLTGIVSEAHPDGKSYTITSPSAKTGLQLQRVMQMWQEKGVDRAPKAEDIADLLALCTDDDGNPVDYRVKIMGPAYQEMVSDGVSADRLDMITTLVTTHYGSGSGVARMMVDAAGEAPARGNRATRRSTQRTAKKTAGSRSRRASTAETGSATETTSETSASSTSPTAPGEEAKAV